MKQLKKVEVIADSVEMTKIIDTLEKLKISGYTLFKGVSGRGDRGMKNDDGLTGVFTNTYLIIVCSESESNAFIELVRPLLKRVGGICLVSDVQWVIH
ncbi:MAG: P-II family nitrogen regulator [Elusimicrobiota bacterium]